MYERCNVESEKMQKLQTYQRETQDGTVCEAYHGTDRSETLGENTLVICDNKRWKKRWRQMPC